MHATNKYKAKIGIIFLKMFKNDYQSRMNHAVDENGNLLTNTHNMFITWNKYLVSCSK
jgi:hypothetical protein